MKKIYNKPAIELVEVQETTALLLASELNIYDDTVDAGLSRESEFTDEVVNVDEF